MSNINYKGGFVGGTYIALKNIYIHIVFHRVTGLHFYGVLTFRQVYGSVRY